MKKTVITHLFILFIFYAFVTNVQAQCFGGRCTVTSYNNTTFNAIAAKFSEQKEAKTYHYEEMYDEQTLREEQTEYEKQRRKYEPEYYAEDDEDFMPRRDVPWKRKGFEFYIGSGIYFGGKKTANYYNGAPENAINLNSLINNQYRWDEVIEIMKRAYPYIVDNVSLYDPEAPYYDPFNRDSRYNISMDVSLGAKYRIQQNWFLELSYSFRRLTCSNRFTFYFPGVPPGNVLEPYNLNYSRFQDMVAKEDRHYIDFSLGYIIQKHEIVKPFFSVGVLFNYVRIKSFYVIFEGDETNAWDLMAMTRYPNWVPGVQDMPDYTDWAGPGFGFSLSAGLKIAINRAASLDPIFQLSVGSFGNSKYNLPNFYTSPVINYMVGVRIVMNDALFAKKQ